jgi:hypothetical protein
MGDSQETRVVRLRADIERTRSGNRGTMVGLAPQPPRVVMADHRAIFNQHQRRLHQLTRGYTKAGLAIFALHAEREIAGHLWLQASETLRSGIIGRHSQVDLYLADDEGLSLRHLLVLVKRREGGLWFRIADLATQSGFQTERGEILRAADANGPFIFQAGNYSFVVIPTGETPPWDPEDDDPWHTLPPRIRVRDEGKANVRIDPPARPRGRMTSVTHVQGLAEPGPERVLDSGESVRGHLLLSSGGIQERLSVGGKALQRGLIIGRYARCVGDTANMADAVSRVHAVVIEMDGQVHLLDAASTNGTFVVQQEVKCVPMLFGATYTLGGTLLRWEAAVSPRGRGELHT